MKASTNEELFIIGCKCISGVRRLREAAEAKALRESGNHSPSINSPNSEAVTAHTRPLDSMADYISRGSQFTIDRDLVKCGKAVG